MRGDGGIKEKEGLILVILDEPQRFSVDDIGAVNAFSPAGIRLQDDFLPVVPQVVGIVIVGQSLAVIPEELIDALIDRVAF